MGIGSLMQDMMRDGRQGHPIARMRGQTLVNIEGLSVGSERVVFTAESGAKFTFWHSADCCETVEVNQIDGDPADLIGSPLVMAEDVSSEAPDADAQGRGPDAEWRDESFTWTFYKFATVKGYVTVRWYGSSNGYYSEDVRVRCKPADGPAFGDYDYSDD